MLIYLTSLEAIQHPFIISHDGLIDARAQEKILEIGMESKTKLKVNLYVDIKENNGIDIKEDREIRKKQMKEKEELLIQSLQKPYAILSISIDQLYTNILMSDDLKNIIDKNDILDNYVIPLLASKDKNSLFAKTSAAVLNGYAQMADSVAQSKDMKLDSSIGSEGKTAGTIWKVFMYTLVVAGLFLYVIILLREKKYKKGIK